MKQFVVGAVAIGAALVSAQCVDDGGNYYCSQVEAISYTNVQGGGSYNQITSMDNETGVCGSQPYGYSGPLAMFNEEVSVHIRGPIHMTQFAAYAPGGASSKKRRDLHRHAHAHHHLHAARSLEHLDERQAPDIVYATINGELASWTNNYFGPSSTAAPAPSAPAYSAPAAAPVVSSVAAVSSAAPVSSAAAPAGGSSGSGSSGSASVPAGSWGQKSYYNSAAGTADNVVFLNNHGGEGSGVFDDTFGMSLSHASADGCSGVEDATTLADTTLPSNNEVILMTSQACEGDDCGFYRDGTVPYHGWDGSSKAFFFEFEMPQDYSNTDPYTNGNMPAIWIMNAQIPRTLEYGNSACSCWISGCGEFDVFEVLAPSDTRAKSTLHGNIQGGDSNYFARPTGGLIQLAVIMSGTSMHIKIIDGFSFASDISSKEVKGYVNAAMDHTGSVSLFTPSHV